MDHQSVLIGALLKRSSAAQMSKEAGIADKLLRLLEGKSRKVYTAAERAGKTNAGRVKDHASDLMASLSNSSAGKAVGRAGNYAADTARSAGSATAGAARNVGNYAADTARSAGSATAGAARNAGNYVNTNKKMIGALSAALAAGGAGGYAGGYAAGAPEELQKASKLEIALKKRAAYRAGN